MSLLNRQELMIQGPRYRQDGGKNAFQRCGWYRIMNDQLQTTGTELMVANHEVTHVGTPQNIGHIGIRSAALCGTVEPLNEGLAIKSTAPYRDHALISKVDLHT